VERDLYACHPALIYSAGQALPILAAVAAAAVAIAAPGDEGHIQFMVHVLYKVQSDAG
jgi:hypothetical protein